MPIQSTFTDLRAAAHAKANFGFKPSDRVDFLVAATALPFVDVIVPDNKTRNLLADCGRPLPGQAQIVRLSELRDTLAATAAGSGSPQRRTRTACGYTFWQAQPSTTFVVTLGRR